jgi:predicted nucleotidyltransferase
MAAIADILRARDLRRQAEAAAAARAALLALKQAGFPAWLVGSLARGDFRQHSDIDILIDVPPRHRSAALRICLNALGGFPSSIVFRGDLPPHALPHFMQEASDEPRLRR